MGLKRLIRKCRKMLFWIFAWAPGRGVLFEGLVIFWCPGGAPLSLKLPSLFPFSFFPSPSPPPPPPRGGGKGPPQAPLLAKVLWGVMTAFVSPYARGYAPPRLALARGCAPLGSLYARGCAWVLGEGGG